MSKQYDFNVFDRTSYDLGGVVPEGSIHEWLICPYQLITVNGMLTSGKERWDLNRVLSDEEASAMYLEMGEDDFWIDSEGMKIRYEGFMLQETIDWIDNLPGYL